MLLRLTPLCLVLQIIRLSKTRGLTGNLQDILRRLQASAVLRCWRSLHRIPRPDPLGRVLHREPLYNAAATAVITAHNCVIFTWFLKLPLPAGEHYAA